MASIEKVGWAQDRAELIYCVALLQSFQLLLGGVRLRVGLLACAYS